MALKITIHSHLDSEHFCVRVKKALLHVLRRREAYAKGMRVSYIIFKGCSVVNYRLLSHVNSYTAPHSNEMV